MAPVDPRRAVGNRGEDLALRFLEGLGYTLVARNWRCRAGELDLVVREQDCLVFVEVKTRLGEAAGRAQMAHSRAQSRRMLNAGEWFVGTHPEFEDLTWRCDLIAITFGRSNERPVIEHFINAIVTG